MLEIHSIDQLDEEIRKLLQACGGEEIEVGEVTEEARESLQEIREDAIEHGEDPNTPFF